MAPESVIRTERARGRPRPSDGAGGDGSARDIRRRARSRVRQSRSEVRAEAVDPAHIEQRAETDACLPVRRWRRSEARSDDRVGRRRLSRRHGPGELRPQRDSFAGAPQDTNGARIPHRHADSGFVLRAGDTGRACDRHQGEKYNG